MSYESPLSVRKAKILPEKCAESASTLAWTENEQLTDDPMQNDGKHNDGNVVCKQMAATAIVENVLEGTPNEADSFLNNVEANNGAVKKCDFNKKISKINAVRSLIPWGVPWVMVANSFIQVK